MEKKIEAGLVTLIKDVLGGLLGRDREAWHAAVHGVSNK